MFGVCLLNQHEGDEDQSEVIVKEVTLSGLKIVDRELPHREQESDPPQTQHVWQRCFRPCSWNESQLCGLQHEP